MGLDGSRPVAKPWQLHRDLSQSYGGIPEEVPCCELAGFALVDGIPVEPTAFQPIAGAALAGMGVAAAS